ncbi:MAG: GNAT family N-acetyltransferase [Anaerolineae bacterium]
MMDALQEAIPTSQYSYDELADIYNRAREDYIVPMPMNARRMEEYITAYDVDLDASFVARDTEDGAENGVCMLGVRGDRTWITRLGVIPVRRRRRSGLFLMQSEIDISRQMGKSLVQLEVIKGNEPAHRLFLKLGFEVTRELLVVRRAPGALDPSLVPEMSITPIEDEVVFDVLAERDAGAAWTEETVSLRNAGKMTGLHVTLPDGETGWVVFQKSAFQLSHFVLAPDISEAMMRALIASVHHTHPMQDTKIENIPLLHPTWPIFQQFGYMVAFGRIEMILSL